MTNKSIRSYVDENLQAVKPHQAAMLKVNRRKLCWSCQKDKSTHGGHMDIRAGLHKFVCVDCMNAKKAKNEMPTVQSTD